MLLMRQALLARSSYVAFFAVSILLLAVAGGNRAAAQETGDGTEGAETTAAAESESVTGVEDTGGEHGSDGEHGSHAEGHDENDPTHANVSDDTWSLVQFRGDLALFSTIVFLLLLAGLTSVAWKPIIQGLEKRERRIADNIAHAERVSQEADAKLAEYESKLAAAAHEATQVVAEARKDAEAAGQKLIASAQEEATRIKERAVADIESAKRVALGELASQSSELAMALARRVVGHEVRAEDHQSLIQEMLAKLPSDN